MLDDLTDEEREFLFGHSGSVLASLTGDTGAKGQAATAAAEAIATICNRYASRTERLLVLTALAAETTRARDALLRSLLESAFHWTKRDDGEWCALSVQPWEEARLASLAGLSTSTIRRWVKAAGESTLKAAQAAAERS